MFGLGPLVSGGLIFAATVSIIGGTYLIADNRGYVRGYASAVAEVNRANAKSVEDARRAREALDARCRTDPTACLSDPWTRDRPN